MSAAPPFLTTREVAELLRVKERKVYDLAAAGEIPHRRVTGKLLFPRAELTAWIEASPGGALRPPVLTGSHDPLLDWALRESGSGLAALWNGSGEGLDLFAQGGAALTGLHLPDSTGGWNREAAARAGSDGVLLAWAKRSRGLILAPGVRIAGIGDLRGRRVVRRQAGAGGARLLAGLLAEAGLGEDDLAPAGELARTEAEAAQAVAQGAAEAALGIEAMARGFGLGFLPLLQERYDLLIDRRAYFSPPLQRLMGFAQSPALGEKAAALGGYDVTGLGAVRWNGA